ncbi:MAG TPA: MBL fold metallo-hydrolase [Pyrinomonadaceae bacterium]|jgi:glyoxylase-like metal-dependent hydrolase (beta-lactamase superfamily II)/rhodanese-related sulfurtransferase
MTEGHISEESVYFKQFYLGCLAHASYLIGSEGEAAVVDPQRDVEQYIAAADAEGLKIKYVVETHLHADFVSGHCELAARTGAEIVFSRHARAAFPHRAVSDGEELSVGRVTLRFMETPGHTPESMCVLLIDRDVSERPQKVLTGDTLFIGDVGRPDLSGSRGHTAEAMAAALYESLHDKLLKLDDAVEVFPAHGAGSMCGRNISSETSSTIGQQRKFNYALADMTVDEFVRMMTSGMPTAPGYFSRDAEINRNGAPALEALPRAAALAPGEVESAIVAGALVLDVRAAAVYGAGHIQGSLNIGLGGQFASWAGSLIAPETPLVLVADDEAKAEEARLRLARVGLENVKGFLRGGIDAWLQTGREASTVRQITVDELHQRIQTEPDLQLLDVRRPNEYIDGHAPGARLATLSELPSNPLDWLDPARPVAVICAGGYRSSAAASLLESRGFRELFNVTGGTSGYVEAGYPVEKTAD